VIDDKNILKQDFEVSLNPILSSMALEVANEAVDQLITEGGNDFYNYFKRTGLAKDKALIVLSQRYSYFYGEDEMASAHTIVNLKELNQIPDLKSVFHSQLETLPEQCNYVGCFVNSDKYNRHSLRPDSASDRMTQSDFVELGIYSRFPLLNRLYSMIDSKTNIYMSERSVTALFQMYGFSMLDMTECKGITFFHSRKAGKILN
jgi:hypothetical protein